MSKNSVNQVQSYAREILLCAVCAFFVGVGVHIHRGNYSPGALTFVLFGWTVLAFGLWHYHRGLDGKHINDLISTLLVVLVMCQMIVGIPELPADHLYVKDTTVFRLGVYCTALWVIFSANDDSLNPWWKWGIFLTSYWLLSWWIIWHSPAPKIDVWHIHQGAVEELLRGANPYEMTFKNIYKDSKHFGAGMVNYGAELVRDGIVQVGFPYPPLTLLLSVPGKVLFGDYRYSLLGANILSAAGLALVGHRRFAFPAVAVWLLTPRSFIMLEKGWNEPYLMFSFVLFSILILRVPKHAGWGAGLVLASKQYAIIFLPLIISLIHAIYSSWRPRIKFLIQVFVVAGLVTIPFVIANPSRFIWDVFQSHAAFPFRRDSINVAAWLCAYGHNPPGPIWTIGALIYFYIITWAYLRRGLPSFTISCILALFAFFAFARAAHLNYYWLIIALCSLAISLCLPQINNLGSNTK